MPAVAVASPPPVRPTSPEIVKIIDGILRFHEVLTGHPFYTYQYVFAYRILEAMMTDDDADRLGSTITGLWSRQSGKSSCVAELVVVMAILLPVLAKTLPQLEFLQKFSEGLRVAIFAPIDPQAKISYDKMRELLATDRAKLVMADPEINVTITMSRGDQLTFSNGSMVVAKSASPDSSIEGISGLHVILIDEAQGVDAFKVDKEIEPMRASTNGIMIKIGTASITRGGFRTDIERNIAAFRAGLAPRNHFEFPYDQIIRVKEEMYRKTGKKIHLSYARYVEGKKKEMGGEKSPAFRMNFMLKWQEARMDAVSDKALAVAKDLERELNVDRGVAEGSKRVRVAGVDVGKGTHDPTVVTINEFDPENPILIVDPVTRDVTKLFQHHFIALAEFEGNFEDVEEVGQYTKVVEFLRQWGAVRVTIDATSMGDPVYQRFTVLASDIEWEPFRYTASTKSDLFTYYLQEFEGERIHVASGGMSKAMLQWQKFFEEHKTLQKTTVGDSKMIRVRAPEPKGQKKLPGEREFHDDYPNSAALAVWCTKSELQGEVQVDESSGYTGRGYGTTGAQTRYARRY